MSSNKKWPTRIGLVMVVKDEAEIIGRCISSVKPLISTWTICDTGSTDGTQDVIMELLGDVEGQLVSEPWVNYGYNRTKALEYARGTADYLLMLDADMQVVVRDKLPKLRADAYMLSVEDGTDFAYRLPLLISGRKDWRYRGVTHEYLDSTTPFTKPHLDQWAVYHSGEGSNRPEKLERDLALLTAEFARDPADPRTIFYLAQTHRDLGNIGEAISFYRLRAEMGGWGEETYYARYQIGCLLAAHVSFEKGADELMQAWRERPARIESLRALANSANAVADKALLPDDSLFVHSDLYTSVG